MLAVQTSTAFELKEPLQCNIDPIADEAVLSRGVVSLGQFQVGHKASVAAKFEHHGSVRALWKEWRPMCQRNIYPFNEGAELSDFDPVFDSLIEKEINDPASEAWPAEFLPHIEALIARAHDSELTDGALSRQLFYRAAALCHIARYPVLSSDLRRHIWALQKRAYLSATSFLPDPVQDISIPHKHGVAGHDGPSIPLYYRYPGSTAGWRGAPVPVILQITGLDGFRGDAYPSHGVFFHAHGWAVVTAEIPGCGDCPAARHDPESPDRLWSSVLDWIAAQPELDEKRVCVWGYSTGAYYSTRVAHTHGDRIVAAVAQGLFAHHAFSSEWLDLVEGGEYYSSLSRALCWKFGYGSVEALREDGMRRFSLAENGILDRECCRLLLLNGKQDSIYPVEDTEMVMRWRANVGRKEIWLADGAKHMGEPKCTPIGLEWLKGILGEETGRKTEVAENADGTGLKGSGEQGERSMN